MEKLITPDELASILSKKVQTLAGWRVKGIGPKVTKIGVSVRYKQSDVDAWINEGNK